MGLDEPPASRADRTFTGDFFRKGKTMDDDEMFHDAQRQRLGDWLERQAPPSTKLVMPTNDNEVSSRVTAHNEAVDALQQRHQQWTADQFALFDANDDDNDPDPDAAIEESRRLTRERYELARRARELARAGQALVPDVIEALRAEQQARRSELEKARDSASKKLTKAGLGPDATVAGKVLGEHDEKARLQHRHDAERAPSRASPGRSGERPKPNQAGQSSAAFIVGGGGRRRATNRRRLARDDDAERLRGRDPRAD